MTSDEQYMQRCIDLARLGASSVSPNPMVGAVLVNNGRIIGEGYHQRYGGPHAEVNCIHSVREPDMHLIPSSTLYVSLEPCAHFGKTPPCADLIIRHAIPVCKIGCRDPFEAVNGKGIEKLIAAGVEVETGLLEEKCQELNRRFFTWHVHKRPFIVLKWAQTADGFIGYKHRQKDSSGSEVSFEEDQKSTRLMVSNDYTNRLVHKWRSEEQAILVGTNTALQDDPSLTNRHWPGSSPLRVVLDMQLRLPSYLHLFTDGGRTVIFNGVRSGKEDNCQFYQLDKNKSIIPQMLEALYALGIQSVLVEGGARLLQSFIDNDAWDEVRVITNTKQTFLATENEAGCRAPVLRSFTSSSLHQFSDDRVQLFKPLAK